MQSIEYTPLRTSSRASSRARHSSPRRDGDVVVAVVRSYVGGHGRWPWWSSGDGERACAAASSASRAAAVQPVLGHLIPFAELARRLVADHGLAATLFRLREVSPGTVPRRGGVRPGRGRRPRRAASAGARGRAPG